MLSNKIYACPPVEEWDSLGDVNAHSERGDPPRLHDPSEVLEGTLQHVPRHVGRLLLATLGENEVFYTFRQF